MSNFGMYLLLKYYYLNAEFPVSYFAAFVHICYVIHLCFVMYLRFVIYCVLSGSYYMFCD